MIARIKLVLTKDESDYTTGSVQEISVVVKGNPIKKVKVGNTEVKSNYNVENGLARLYNTFEYGSSDTINQYANVKYNSYVYSFDINEKFNSSNPRLVKFHPYGSLSNGNIRLYPWYDIPNETYYPNTGEWPSPVFLKTALVIKNGSTLTIGIKGSVVNLYNDSNYSGAPVYSTSVDGNITAIYNLKPKTTYYYRVLDSNNNILFSGNFTTEGLIRFIRLPQVHNVRDCGGWKTIDGQNRFKYGVLFRGAQFNAYLSNPSPSTLTKAANELLKLGVNKRIDITEGDDVESIRNIIARIVIEGSDDLSYGVIYNNFLIFALIIKEIITNVGNGNATYLHCLQGRDRTGSLVATIQALCGISEDGIIKDYELTTAWGNLTTRNYMRNLWTNFINNYSNNTLYPTILSKVEAWFKSNYSGVSDTYKIKDSENNSITDAEEALTRIKNVLLEDVPLSERTIAIIGDSYSAYHTYKPILTYDFNKLSFPPDSLDSLYYGEFPCRDKTNVRNDVVTPNQMWWYQTAINLGINPETQLSLAAWSGTFVSDFLYLHKQLKESTITERDTLDTTFTQDPRPASSPQRIKHLSNKFRGAAPDIIICEIGMNDARYLVADGTTVPNEKYIILNNNLGNKELYMTTTYIVSYYKCMLDNIISQYPKAKIFCMTPVNFSDAYTSKFESWTSKLVKLLNTSYPEVSLINVYDAFTELGVVNTTKYTIADNTHPNAAGNTKIANLVVSAINEYYLL